MSSLQSATVQITINSFVPFTGDGSATIGATLALAPGGSSGITINSDGDLTVSVPAGTPVQINYILTNPAIPTGGSYVLQGVYFTSAPSSAMGTQQFPLLILSRAESQSITLSAAGQTAVVPPNTMTVIDLNVPPTEVAVPPTNPDDPVSEVSYASALFTYNILVQDTAQPAAIGIIDPGIENDPNET